MKIFGLAGGVHLMLLCTAEHFPYGSRQPQGEEKIKQIQAGSIFDNSKSSEGK